uniref:Uncharacterized protein n=1 Tax=Salix viminalis TaxID=40686 RepID=A0A6N2KQB1_SALVM
MESLTLTALLSKSAKNFPNRRAISLSGKLDLTHAQLQQIVDHAASLLISAGISPVCDHVSGCNSLPSHSCAVKPGLHSRGVRVLPLRLRIEASNHGHKSQSYRQQTAASKLKIPHVTSTLDFQSKRVTLSTVSDSLPDAVDEVVNDSSDVALFLHTSGTTSRPKGVPLTQLNLASSVLNIKSVYKLTESDSTVIVLPLFHVHGLLAGLLSSLVAGAAVTLPATGRFSASTFWKDMVTYNATWYTAVPTVHQILLDRHVSKPEPAYPKLRFIRSCSASLAPVIMDRLEAAFGAPVLEAYAMTEAAHLMASNPLPEDGPHKPGSVGRPIGQEMTILNENGVAQPVGVSGEVCIRGLNVTMGYKNNPEGNKAAYQYGWFHTGDLGFLDEDGYLHLVGRIKELINRGGEKISPLEVDAVLLSHPDIAQAVAFGVPDEKYGEEINCAIIPREGLNIDEDEVLSFCKKNLATFKVPKKVFITDSLPKTATGKIQRRIVAEHFLAQISTAKVPKFGA